MPFLKTDGLEADMGTMDFGGTYDYNLADRNTNGLSIQAVVHVIGAGGSLNLLASNNGIDFVDIPGSNYNAVADTSVIWNLGSPAYKIVRVNVIVNSGQISCNLIFNGTNLS